MSEPSVAHRIRAFLIEEFVPDVPADELPSDYDLVQGGVIDSLGLLKIIAWIEEQFEIPAELLDLDPESFRSIGAIETLIEGARTAAR
jgi:acyl carrier protein